MSISSTRTFKELGARAFAWCDELKSMMIPDSLWKVGEHVFVECYKLVPSHVDEDLRDSFYVEDATSEVVGYLHLLTPHLRVAVELEKMLAQRDTTIANQATVIANQTTAIANQATEITALKTEIETLKIAHLRSQQPPP